MKSAVNFGSKGYANINGQIVTKHDPEISGHRNMQKITDNMPLSFPCGDAHTSKMPLSNKIYNELRRSAHKGNFQNFIWSNLQYLFYICKSSTNFFFRVRSDVFNKKILYV